jgi:hypothetical protein
MEGSLEGIGIQPGAPSHSISASSNFVHSMSIRQSSEMVD